MNSLKKIVGLDVGDKRIGIAVSDALHITAQGLESYVRTDSEQKDIEHIAVIVRDSGADTIVCGFPKNMNGTIGPQAEKVRDFAEKIKEFCGVEIIYWDERLTTVMTERMLIDANVRRNKRRQIIDKLAAVVILQSYLDSK